MRRHSVAVLLASVCAAICSARQVCYQYVGCFDNSHPFDDIRNDVLPESPEKIGTVFLLYTRRNKGEPLSYYDTAALRNSTFNKRLPTKFIIHGFTQDAYAPWMHAMKDALLAEGDFNVVIVGWKNGAAGPNYLQAVANTRVVGEQVAGLIRLMIGYGVLPAQVHIIGHSLGAHISGFAGSSLRGILGRISGLDPAGPSFKNEDVKARLDPSDAIFVDAIHTNGAPIINGGAGISQGVGHVDFYPNGGRRQPGCPDVVPGGISALFSTGLTGVGKVAACSHDRSCDLYTESISSKTCRFQSVSCSGDYEDFLSGGCSSCISGGGCSEMGYRSDEYPARGRMFLLTKGAPGFCGFPGFVKIDTPDADVVGELTMLVYTDQGNLSIPILSRGQRIPDSGAAPPVLFPVEIGSIGDVSMMYVSYEGHLFGVGAGRDSWSLSSLAIQDPAGNRKTYCSRTAIVSGTLAQLYSC